MSLVLHLLSGEALRGGAPVEATELAAAFGPGLRPVTAFWISERCGRHDHEFLRDDLADGRIARLAAALSRDFGRRHAPLIVAPGLVPPGLVPPGLATGDGGGPVPVAAVPDAGALPRLDWIAVLAQLQAALTAQGDTAPLHLHGLAAGPVLPPAAVLAGLAALAADLAAAGIAAIVPPEAVAEPAPGSVLHSWILRNIRGRILSEEVATLGRRHGMEIADPARLLAFCDTSLQRWAAIGLAPAVTDRAAFARLGARLLDRFAEETRA